MLSLLLKKNPRFLPVAALAVICVYAISIPVAAAAFKNLTVGDAVPPLVLQDLQGQELIPPDYGQSKAVVLVFWATWSSRSMTELDDIIKLKEKYADKGLYILAINVEKQAMSEQDMRKIRSFVEEKQPGFTVAMDQGLKTYNEWGVIATPTTAIIDSSGVMVFELSSYATHGFNDLEAAVEKALEIAPEILKPAVAEPSYQPDRQALLHLGLGKRLLNKGFTTKALSEFAKSAEADTNYAEAYIYLGYTMLKEKNEVGAEASLTRAMNLDPPRPAPVLLSAFILTGRKMPVEAVALLEQFSTARAASRSTEDAAEDADAGSVDDIIDLTGIKALLDEGKIKEACSALDQGLSAALEDLGFSVLKKKRSDSIMERMKLMIENREQQ